MILPDNFQEAATVRLDREKALTRDASGYTHPLIALNGPHFDGSFFSLIIKEAKEYVRKYCQAMA